MLLNAVDENETGTLAKDENVSDLDWLKSRSIRIKEDGEFPENVSKIKPQHKKSIQSVLW